MSVREYIGARYVPVFADPIQWDITTAYEPLTVVKNEGASYVSRKYVPEGIQLSNTDYWILWADYNAQLQQYINTVNTFDGRIDALEDGLPVSAFDSTSTVKDSLNAIEANNWVTTSRIADKAVTNAKLADALNKKLITDNSLRNECILMLGDSYAQGTGSDGTNWQSLLINLLDLQDTYVYKAGSAGFLTVSTSTSGSSSPVPTNTTYSEVLGYAYEYINGLGRADEVKHIIIQCGWNDSNATNLTESALETAIINCLTNLHTWFPNAKIYIACTYCGSIDKTSQKTKSIVSQAANNAANRKGAACAQCVNLPWLFSNASTDTVHPTAAMQNYIAGFIARLLSSGYAEDFEGWSADEVAWISKNHEFIYNARLTTTVQSGTNIIINANWSRAYNSGRYNQDFPVVFSNETDGANGIGLGRFYVDGSVKIVYAVQSSGSMNGGDEIIITPNTRIKFH